MEEAAQVGGKENGEAIVAGKDLEGEMGFVEAGRAGCKVYEKGRMGGGSFERDS